MSGAIAQIRKIQLLCVALRRTRFILPALLLSASLCFAANHPPTSTRNDNCTACHADMITGVSVHAQGDLSCSMCHVTVPRDGGAAISLVGPKQEICFNCHERTAMQQHWRESKRECMDCHDAHHSARSMLLRRNIDLSYTQGTEPSRSVDSPSSPKQKTAAKLQKKSAQER